MFVVSWCQKAFSIILVEFNVVIFTGRCSESVACVVSHELSFWKVVHDLQFDFNECVHSGACIISKLNLAQEIKTASCEMMGSLGMCWECKLCRFIISFLCNKCFLIWYIVVELYQLWALSLVSVIVLCYLDLCRVLNSLMRSWMLCSWPGCKIMVSYPTCYVQVPAFDVLMLYKIMWVICKSISIVAVASLLFVFLYFDAHKQNAIGNSSFTGVTCSVYVCIYFVTTQLFWSFSDTRETVNLCWLASKN